MNSEHKYILLEALYEHKDEYWPVKDFWNNVSYAIGFDDYLKLIDEFQKREYVDPDEDDLMLVAIGINHYLELRAEKKKETQKEKASSFDRLLKNSGIIFMAVLTAISVTVAVITYLNNRNTRALEPIIIENQRSIKALQAVIDSLIVETDSTQFNNVETTPNK